MITSTAEPDDFDDEDAPASKPAAAESSGPTLDKMNASAAQRLQMDVARVKERKISLILGAVVLVTLCTILAVTWMALFGPEPNIPLKPPTHRLITTENTSHFADNETVESAQVAPGEVYHYQWERSLTDEDDSNAAEAFCGTADCQDVVRFLEHQLDKSHDACSSLYDHVCSGWQRQYKKQASGDGIISVDDVVAGVYRDRLAALLSDKGHAFPKARSLFSNCAREGLASEQDVSRILHTIRTIGNDSSEEGIARGIARMASLGVSPFFDVVANVTNDTAYVRILAASSTDVRRLNYDVPNTEIGARGRVSSSGSLRKANSVFLSAFRRQLCLEVKQVASDVKHCVLMLSPDVTVNWSRRWFETTGTQRLLESAVSLLKPVSPQAEGTHGKAKIVNPQSSSHVKVKKERSLACLRLTDAYDSASLASLAANTVPPSFKAVAEHTLGVLKASLVEIYPGAPSISFKLGPPPPLHTFGNETLIPENKNDVYGSVSMNGDGKLEKLLRAATWRLWLNHGTKEPAAFSTVSSFVESSSTLHVPLPVFNSSTGKDPWLRSLSLARVGPRALKTLFRGRLAAELDDSQLARCVSRRQTGDLLKVGTSRDLDMEEVASFYTSLRAYRGQVGDAVLVTGSDLNSDSLFLLFYAFNNCEAVSTEPSVNETTMSNRGRRRVDSVAAVFSSALLERCEGPSEVQNCDV